MSRLADLEEEQEHDCDCHESQREEEDVVRVVAKPCPLVQKRPSDPRPPIAGSVCLVPSHSLPRALQIEEDSERHERDGEREQDHELSVVAEVRALMRECASHPWLPVVGPVFVPRGLGAHREVACHTASGAKLVGATRE